LTKANILLYYQINGMKRRFIIIIVAALLLLSIGLLVYFYFNPLPANTGPAQAPQSDAGQILVGAYYYTYDADNSPFWQNYLRKKLNITQVPLLGEYNSRKPEIIRQHLDWARDSGIDFFAVNWFGPGSTSDVTVKNYFSSYLAKNNIDFRFCLAYQTPYILNFDKGIIFIDREALRQIQNHFLYLAEEYFSDPHYLKINNRPVLFISASHLLRGEYEMAITKTLNIVRQRTGHDTFVVGDEIILPEGDSKQTMPDAKRIKIFDAITACNLWGSQKYNGLPVVTGFFNDLNGVYEQYFRISRDMKIGFIPCAMPGFNNLGFSRPGGTMAILPREATIDKENEGTTYYFYLRLARKYLDPGLNILMINSFNGFNEDTQIEPAASAFITPASAPAELTGGYKYYGYQDLYLKITKQEIAGE